MKKIRLILKNFFVLILLMLTSFMLVAGITGGIIFAIRGSEIEPVKKHDVVIVKENLPSRYGGWRVQGK